MSATARRLPEFEVVRAISILLLLIHHSGFYSLEFTGLSLQWLSPYLEAFLLGCFFFISGYFMELSLQRSGGNSFAFLRSRLIKIYPPYLIAFALYVFVLGYGFKSNFDVAVWLAGLQFIFSPSFVKPLLTLWYIGAILLFYGLFLVLWKVAPKTISLVIVSVAVFILAVMLHRASELLDVRFFKYYFVFLTGLLLAKPNTLAGALSSQWMLGKSILALLGIWFFSFALHAEADSVSLFYVAASYTFIVSNVVLLFAVIAKLSIVSPWRWVIAISHASYFVYLFHRPFWKILEGAFPLQGLQDQILFRMIPASVIALAACYFLQQFYDFLVGKLKRQSQGLNSTV
ncbi:MAG TPA: acyltransferase [Anaerolineales bacterium]|nr:acyltransferase [Anaerolineales bacterium]HQX17291.1 acyltransferase [Anaerolineales bacterium]